MLTIYDIFRKYLPSFVVGAKERLTGTIAVPNGTGAVSIVGTGTIFTHAIAVGDELIIWKPDSVNFGARLNITGVTNDTTATATTAATLVAELGIYGVVIGNEILQAIMIAADNILEPLLVEMRSGMRSDIVALRQFCREWLMYPGGWEDATQLEDFLAVVFELHQRRGTEGANMADLDDPTVGILGECDRLTMNPGGTSILDRGNIMWTLAGDIELVIHTDGLGDENAVPTDATSGNNLLFSYPDYTAPSAGHPRGEYSPGNDAICYLDIIDAILIRMENLNDGHLSDRRIEEIVKNIVPFDIAHFVEFYT